MPTRLLVSFSSVFVTTVPMISSFFFFLLVNPNVNYSLLVKFSCYYESPAKTCPLANPEDCPLGWTPPCCTDMTYDGKSAYYLEANRWGF